MSRVAQKEDLGDPEVIRNFAKRVGNERYLTALYLLTVADIRGTSPKVWNAWKGKLLEDLYRYGLRALGGGAPDPKAEIETRKREALVQLQLFALPFEAHKKLWDTLDVGYFMRHDAGDIVWHTRHVSRHVGAAKAIVRARMSPVGEGLQVMVYTADQPDLFARICGYFDQAGFSILDAKIHTATNGYALDTFQVVTAMLPEHYRELCSMVESDLGHTIAAAGRWKHADKPESWVSFHSFRHTCASLLFEAGKSIKQVQEWLGHANISTTQIYTQVKPETPRQLVTPPQPPRLVAVGGRRG